MPIAVHPSTPPLVKTTSGDTVTSLSTAPFSPPAGSVILAFVMQDSTTGGAAPNLGITNNGTALSWIVGPVRDSNDPQDYPTAVKVFAAPVPVARTNLTVTGTSNLENDTALRVYVLTGVHQTTPFGNVSENSQSGNTLVTTAFASAYAGSWAFVGAVEGGPLSAAPTPSGFTASDPFIISSEMTGCVGYKTLGAAGSTISFTIDGAGTSSTNWNWVAVEIRAGSQNIGPVTSIPQPDNQFGTTVLQPQEVTFGPAGGIPAGNVGTPRIQRPIKVTAGISSAEGFGNPIIGHGFRPVGIKSEESFGSPVIHNYGLGPFSIPPALAFGNPTVLRGAVTIIPEYPDDTPNGIPSQESVSQPKLNLRLKMTGIPSEMTFGGTRVRIVQIVKRTVPQRTLTKYELVMIGVQYNTAGQPSFTEIDPIEWSSIQYSDELNAPQALSTGCNIQKLSPALIQRIQNLEHLPTELLLRRNGVTVFTGPLLGANVSGEVISFEAQGILAYLNGMYVSSDLAFNTDQFTIVKNLVDHWQNGEYGNFGINTANIGTSGVTREIVYKVKEGHRISDRINDLAQGTNGFDYGVDPTTREMQLYYPFRGVDRSQGEDSINFDAQNVTSADITISVAPTDIATQAIGASNNNEGAAYVSIYENAELKAKRGRVGIFGSFEADSQANLDNQTAGLLLSRGGIFLVPGGRTRVTKETDIGKYNIGDTVSYELHKRLQVRGAFRLRKRTVSVNSTGTETADFEFA